jgi:hypothetical protein
MRSHRSQMGLSDGIDVCFDRLSTNGGRDIAPQAADAEPEVADGVSEGISYFRAETSNVYPLSDTLPSALPCGADFTISSSTVFLVFAGS